MSEITVPRRFDVSGLVTPLDPAEAARLLAEYWKDRLREDENLDTIAWWLNHAEPLETR